MSLLDWLSIDLDIPAWHVVGAVLIAYIVGRFHFHVTFGRDYSDGYDDGVLDGQGH
jgi:hypothetical protein